MRAPWLLLALSLTLGVMLGSPQPSAAASGRAPAPVGAVAEQPRPPFRAAFYYGWFPETWYDDGLYPFTNYHPSRGYYSLDLSVVQEQIADMRYGKIDVGIASWWGQETPTDQRFPMLLQAAAGTPFKWAVHYEAEGYGDPTVAQIRSDIAYLSAYTENPAVHHIDNRPVFFVFTRAGDPDGCETVHRWRRASAGDVFVVLRAFNGYTECRAQPDMWYAYRSGTPELDIVDQFSIAPGYWKKGEDVLLPRDPAAWRAGIRHMIASCKPWQLVITYNEWGEGTAVESADEWSSASGHGTYVDALHDVRLRSRPNRPLRPCMRRAQR